LRYQPVVDPAGEVTLVEALVRWNRLGREFSPGAFLPVAERAGLLGDLDRWVLRTALAEAAELPVRAEPVSVAVNLSGLHPGEPQFVEQVSGMIDDSGINPNRVVLELLETTAIDLSPETRDAMHALIERDVRFAIDDFGTGHSSLTRFKALPASVIKIDRQFVAGIASDPADYAIARAVLDMGHATGRHCIAEGVETLDQFRILQSLGVDAYQGWLFAPALSPVHLRTLLQRQASCRVNALPRS
jgi:EAL domain-containing protein (putative c-di-GMP-specific phosphodiesterase class I)